MEELINSPKALGIAVKRQRKAMSLTQEEAGKYFKIDQRSVSNIERGALGTRLDTVIHLLAALDLELVVRPKKRLPSEEITEVW